MRAANEYYAEIGSTHGSAIETDGREYCAPERRYEPSGVVHGATYGM